MKKLEDVLPVDKAVACPECGGFVFFDWGLKLLETAYRGAVGQRFEGHAEAANVHVCAGCHHPVVNMSGDVYDAETFIPKDTIEKLIQEGQARHHQVPVRAMDP